MAEAAEKAVKAEKAGRIILVTGGARSGKSTFAERFMMKHEPAGALYAATAQAFDEEMAARIQQHRVDRAATNYPWSTVDCPLSLPKWLHTCTAPAVLVDCLTLWLSNELLTLEQQDEVQQDVEQHDMKQPDIKSHAVESHDTNVPASSSTRTSSVEDVLNERIDALAAAARAFSGTLVLVTNEVGSGVVPAYKLGRLFRDAAGRMNQRLAAVADEVYLVTAGIPIELKSRMVEL
ncbi:bifunctional adenosylcobinamide kinase/adenosylcobinamide-phosphate guanylyltransferase [Paenibacillus sp. 481]|uniref:bifunctional adenosylcobinamide kinase/adenosylcobinamide-phosphate guanylyltransferase n=1 Tax=Paenibacillus sp. 481 TaxID=2835869 RepID=UPI001E5071EC|nr:bifunctional adenosylcobinamide kinase/adenosylcobinamide-phosphate guanylyltransferase [Paenibacillus sp. 481]UHA72104.1 bifunctional adenosylcobinamide kinase/adenosylcobinamide-phosphate guanylyltransferase [Paenibacillus sp. 481]